MLRRHLRAWAPVFAVPLAWPLACSGSRSQDDAAMAGAATANGGSPNGGAGGRGMVTAGTGQGNTAGGSGELGSPAGQGGSALPGSGGVGAMPDGGLAGAARGGNAGEPGGTSGEGGSELAAGTGGNPEGSCRRYASKYTVTSSGGVVTVSCAFDVASLAMTCTSDTGNVTVTTWSTLADAASEYRPIGLTRAERAQETLAFTSGECRLTRDFRYDGSRRLTAIEVTIDPTASCGTNEQTYDAWDSAGRPTHGIENGVGGETCAGGELSVSYDDAQRTITTTHSGGTDCLSSTTVLNHDEDGLRTTAVNGANTTTYATVAVAEICE